MMLIWSGYKIHLTIYKEATMHTSWMTWLRYVTYLHLLHFNSSVYVILFLVWFLCCQIKPLNHSHDLPPLSRSGVTYVCSCMIFLRSTDGGKLLMKTWVEEIQAQPWNNTQAKKPHDQPAFNRALHKTANQVCNVAPPNSTFALSKVFTSFLYLIIG